MFSWDNKYADHKYIYNLHIFLSKERQLAYFRRIFWTWQFSRAILYSNVMTGLCKKPFYKCHITRYKKSINQSNTIENTKKSHG